MSDTCRRSMEHYRKLGFHVAKVEKWNPFARRGKGKGIRQDMFGFGDIFAFDGDYEIICQTTTKNGLNEHIDKISGIPAAEAWIRSNHRRLEVHGWFKRAGRWHVEIRTLRAEIGFKPEMRDPGWASMRDLHICVNPSELKTFRRKPKK